MIHQLHKAVFLEEDIVILPISRHSLARTVCGMRAEVVMAQKLCHISEPSVSDAGRQDLYHRWIPWHEHSMSQSCTMDTHEYIGATHHYIQALQARTESLEDYPERDYMSYLALL